MNSNSNVLYLSPITEESASTSRSSETSRHRPIPEYHSAFHRPRPFYSNLEQLLPAPVVYNPPSNLRLEQRHPARDFVESHGDFRAQNWGPPYSPALRPGSYYSEQQQQQQQQHANVSCWATANTNQHQYINSPVAEISVEQDSYHNQPYQYQSASSNHQNRYMQEATPVITPVTPPPRPAAVSKTIEVLPGVLLRLRGAAETIKAMEHGFFVSTVCPCCRTSICCVGDADFVVCPDCRVVSRITEQPKDGGVGLGFKITVGG